MSYVAKKYAVICTRSEDFPPTTQKLIDYYRNAGIEVKVIVGAKSIFQGYQAAYDAIKPRPNDVIIMSHDDIQILMDPEKFHLILDSNLKDTVGFIGPAGTTYLGEDATWWNHEQWRLGKHRGAVFHGDFEEQDLTYFGNYGPVVVLDGLFLACRASTLKDNILLKPSWFKGEWDFYDILYTFKAHLRGKINMCVPILLAHESRGELAGRESWHENRKAFLNVYGSYLPREL